MKENSNASAHNLQDVFLNELRKAGVTVQIYLTNGFQVRGRIKSFDSFTVLVESYGKEKEEGTREQLIYKHAMSTVIPTKALPEPIIKNSGENE